MKTFISTKRSRALTLIEVLTILAVLIVIVVAYLPRLTNQGRYRAHARIRCINNLRQTGLSIRVWAGDNNDKYPTQISQTNGGSMEFISGPNAFRHFQVMSNELNTPKRMIRPSDSRELNTNYQ